MNKTKLRRVVLIAAITGGLIGGVIIPQSGCTSDSEAATEVQGQIITVQRGDITIDITAAGNLSYSL